MKYGDSLRHRSIPEWAYHNIEYDDIKLLIKESTTPGKAKATSIPGQGNPVEREFAKVLFSVFDEQHSRITLFVRSKTGEISRRLDHLERQLRKVCLSCQTPGRGTRSQRGRWSKIERDAITTGEEIRSLSRFIEANRTAFGKLLKKYRKWTNSSTLSVRVAAEIFTQSDSFTRVDVGQHLDHWTEILQEVRQAQAVQLRANQLYTPSSSHSQSPLLSAVGQSPPRGSSAITAHKICALTQSGSELDFDMALANTPLGDTGTKAVYWVHRDQLIELQVLLLQHLRPYPTKKRMSRTTRTSSLANARQNSAFSLDMEGDFKGNTGTIVLDHLEDFVEVHNRSPISATEEFSGHPTVLAAGSIHWTATDNAAVSIREQQGSHSVPKEAVRIERRHVAALLNTESDTDSAPSRTPASPQVEGSPHAEVQSRSRSSLERARAWLADHMFVKPLACICSRRARFIGIPDSLSSGQWCILDSDISMTAGRPESLVAKDWPVNSSTEGWSFPHAVLEIRQEGKVTTDLIDMLDQSHLTERVRGFSLAAHAVWTCWEPSNMTPPFWLPVLARDIRKVPEPVARRPRQPSSAFSFQGTATPLTNGNTESVGSEIQGGAGSSTALEESSAPSYPNTPIGPSGLEAVYPKRSTKSRVTYSDDALKNIGKKNGIYSTARYWSEYDHAEDGSDDGNGYYIYVDPDETFTWPGQSAYQYIKLLLKWLLRRGQDKGSMNDDIEDSAQQSLINSTTDACSHSASSSSGDEASTDIPSSTHTLIPQPCGKSKATSNTHPQNHRTDYGTLPPPALSAYPEQPQSLRTRHFASAVLTAALTLLVLLSVLTATSRRRARGAADAAVLVGVAACLAFALAGVRALARESDRVGRARWVLAGGAFAVICVGCGALLGWVCDPGNGWAE